MGQWHYVSSEGKQGPVDESVIQTLLNEKKLKLDDYVWTKGFENWRKIKDVAELNSGSPASAPVATAPAKKPEPKFQPAPTSAVITSEDLSLSDVNTNAKILFIRIGVDRGDSKPAEYGPFSLDMLKKLFNENRINGKTEFFTKGMSSWKMLAEDTGYQDIFNSDPPPISDRDKRSFSRKPFMARMFIANNKKLFEGICRDVSVGGMQVLIDNFPGKSGEKVTINVHPENNDHNFVADGEIVRILDGGQGFSFRFTELNDEAKNAIHKYLNS